MAPQDIQDSNPYSRNLILISLAIIIFNFADGEIMNNHLKLHVVNIKFNNVEFFTTFIWIIFFWFLFRFWQTNNFKIERIMYNSTNNMPYMNNIALIKLVQKKTLLKYRTKEGFYSVTLKKNKIIPNDSSRRLMENKSFNIPNKSILWFIVYITLFINICIKDKNALDSYIPYSLALIAFTSSLC